MKCSQRLFDAEHLKSLIGSWPWPSKKKERKEICHDEERVLRRDCSALSASPATQSRTLQDENCDLTIKKQQRKTISKVK